MTSIASPTFAVGTVMIEKWWIFQAVCAVDVVVSTARRTSGELITPKRRIKTRVKKFRILNSEKATPSQKILEPYY